MSSSKSSSPKGPGAAKPRHPSQEAKGPGVDEPRHPSQKAKGPGVDEPRLPSQKAKGPGVDEPREPSVETIWPVVLVAGPQASLRDAAIAALRGQVLAGAPRDFNEDRFDFTVAGTEPAAVIGAARTLPMMARARLVLVRGVGDKRAEKFRDEVLVEYLEAPLASTCLVLEAASVDKRQRWVKRVAKIGRVIDCTGPSHPADVRRWIEVRLEQRGARAGNGVSAALFDLVGADLDRLSLEVEKLCLYAGEQGEIDADTVSELVGQLRPRALYELTDAIVERRLTNALRVVAEVTEQGEAPLVLVGALANHFRRLMRALEIRPLEASEVQKRLGLHPFAARKIVDQARRFDRPRLRFCLDAVRRTDLALKGGVPIAPRLAIERLVLAVCA